MNIVNHVRHSKNIYYKDLKVGDIVYFKEYCDSSQIENSHLLLEPGDELMLKISGMDCITNKVCNKMYDVDEKIYFDTFYCPSNYFYHVFVGTKDNIRRSSCYLVLTDKDGNIIR